MANADHTHLSPRRKKSGQEMSSRMSIPGYALAPGTARTSSTSAGPSTSRPCCAFRQTPRSRVPDRSRGRGPTRCAQPSPHLRGWGRLDFPPACASDRDCRRRSMRYNCLRPLRGRGTAPVGHPGRGTRSPRRCPSQGCPEWAQAWADGGASAEVGAETWPQKW